MQYAILGDIHSSKKDLEKVLADVSVKAPNAICVGTGDLYECIISKKDITAQKYNGLEEIMLIPKGFNELLTFPSVHGNQEERILLISETDDSLREKIVGMPEIIDIGDARIIHGHQWNWGGTPWSLIHADVNYSPVFYGHSHHSALSINGVELKVELNKPYLLVGDDILVNVGAVVGDKEWVHYDAVENTVIFMKA